MKKVILLTAFQLFIVTIGMEAAIHYVKQGGTGEGTSWENAAGNIQDMIDKASAGDEVWVAGGTYFPTYQRYQSINSTIFQLKDGVHLYGSFAGNEASIHERPRSDSDESGKIDLWEFSNPTILSGKISDTERCEYVVDLGGGFMRKFVIETRFDGFTVTEGFTGVYIYGTGVIENCLISNNYSGISNEEGIITHSKVTNNSYSQTTSTVGTTHTTTGGGIKNEKGKVINCVVTDNYYKLTVETSKSTRIRGGGIYNNEGMVDNCIVTGNSIIVSGGGKYVYNLLGGGIYNNKGTVTHCIVRANECRASTNVKETPGYDHSYYVDGGGIYNDYGIVNSCCVTDNILYASTAFDIPKYTQGGGIFNYGNSSAPAYIYCSTVVNNSTDYNVAANDYGFISNSIITNAGNENFINPSTGDYRLAQGSQFINAGSTVGIPEWILNGTDLAGNPRISDGKISMGAYEYTGITSIGKSKLDKEVRIYLSEADILTITGLEGSEILYFYNVRGNLLFTHQAKSKTEDITVNQLPSGIYFVRVNHGKTLKWIRN